MGLAVCLCGTLLTSCQQEMAHQPAYRPLQPSSFFADGRSARPLVPGTVARGFLYTNVHLYEGKNGRTNEWSQIAGLAGGLTQDPLAGISLWLAGDPLVDTFPISVTRELLERGRERFNIYCAVCHDRAGTGNGIVVQRGFTRPPSYHTPRLRHARVGHLYNVITKGYGAMPDYAGQITPQDRWAIVAYVRALQLSQYAPLDAVPPDARTKLEKVGPLP
jgi:mono/diheme cytochrome c family protein